MSKQTCPHCNGDIRLHETSATSDRCLRIQMDALRAERDRYREALETLGKWSEESLCETPATQHPVLDAGSVLDLINKTLLK